MKLVWSPETAAKAYIDTVRACEINHESGVAELISSMAGGWNSKIIVETWKQGESIATSIGLAIATRHTGGRHVCIVPDEASKLEYLRFVGEATEGSPPEMVVGDAEESIGDASMDGVDFLVVDCRHRDYSRVLMAAKISQRGAVLICKNAFTSGFRWRGVIDARRYRLVRTAFLPVGDGLDIAHVGVVSGGANGTESVRRRWVKHVDQCSGEEHVIRTC